MFDLSLFFVCLLLRAVAAFQLMSSFSSEETTICEVCSDEWSLLSCCSFVDDTSESCSCEAATGYTLTTPILQICTIGSSAGRGFVSVVKQSVSTRPLQSSVSYDSEGSEHTGCWSLCGKEGVLRLLFTCPIISRHFCVTSNIWDLVASPW